MRRIVRAGRHNQDGEPTTGLQGASLADVLLPFFMDKACKYNKWGDRWGVDWSAIERQPGAVAAVEACLSRSKVTGRPIAFATFRLTEHAAKTEVILELRRRKGLTLTRIR